MGPVLYRKVLPLPTFVLKRNWYVMCGLASPTLSMCMLIQHVVAEPEVVRAAHRLFKGPEAER